MFQPVGVVLRPFLSLTPWRISSQSHITLIISSIQPNVIVPFILSLPLRLSLKNQSTRRKTLAIDSSNLPHPTQENLHPSSLSPFGIPNASHLSPVSNHMMGLNQILSNSLISLLIFLMLFISTFLLGSSSGTANSDEALYYLTPPGSPSSPAASQVVSRHHQQPQEQVFHMRKGPPAPFSKNKRKRTKRTKREDKMKAGPFAAMLPKGTVPPSGSSTCHNEKPNSVKVFCSLSSTVSSESAPQRE